MKSCSKIILALCSILSPLALQAQNDSIPALFPLLSTLDADLQSKVQDYAYHLGVYYKKTAEATCKQLDAKNQERVARYILVLQNPDKVAPTTVSWDRDTLPFGRIEEGAILLDSFVVTNTGSSPYIITGAKSNCDCTVLRYPNFPVMPGDSATVRVEFDSSNKAGHARPGIILYDNSRPNRRNILYLEGYVAPQKNVKFIRN